MRVVKDEQDWNITHPWNDNLPGVDENEWNKTLTEAEYNAFVQNGLIAPLANGGGGQVIDIPDHLQFGELKMLPVL
jgi:hypothetical protein